MTVARSFADYGGLCVGTDCVTDAANLLLILENSSMTNPAEKNFLIHLLMLKDKLEHKVVNSLRWCDTRDMTADGHTKGNIPRTLIHDIMNGTLTINHPREILTLGKNADTDSFLPPQALVQALFVAAAPTLVLRQAAAMAAGHEKYALPANPDSILDIATDNP